MRLLAPALLIAIGAGACGDRLPLPPEVTAITPSSAFAFTQTPVTLEGRFTPRVRTDFNQPADGGLDLGFVARVGEVELTSVGLGADGKLTGQLPARLAAGVYPVTVVDPSGREAELADGFRAIGPLATFIFEPIGDQEVFLPFQVRIRAVDALGQLYPFSRAVNLEDLTGTASPGTLGPFVDGQLTATVTVGAAHAADRLTVRDVLTSTWGSSAPFVVAVARASAIRFASPARTAVAGDCSAEIVLERLDESGIPTAPASAMTADLALAGLSNVSLYSDPGCGAPTTTALFLAGSSNATVYLRGVTAGTGLLTATAGALPSASQGVTVVAAAPAALAFTSPARTTTPTVCSAAISLEARDPYGNPSPPVASTPLALSIPAGVSLFADAACGAPIGTVALGPATPLATLYFAGTIAADYALDARATGLAGATQTETLLPGPPVRIVLSSAPQMVPSGSCSGALAGHLEDSWGNRAPVSSPTTLNVSASPVANFAFSGIAGCGTTDSSVTLTSGSTLPALFFRGTVPGVFTMTVAAGGLTPAQQVARISGPVTLVRGSCDITSGSALRDCPLSLPSPDLSKTLLVFQATSSGNTPADVQVRCYLPNTGLLSCRRNGTLGDARVAYQILQIPTGLKVQHLQSPCTGPTTVITVPQPVALAGTFLFLSASTGGATSDQNDHYAARLIDASTVEVLFGLGGPCADAFDLQVVELAWASVTRGVTPAIAAGQAGIAVGGLFPVTLTSTFLTGSQRYTDDTDPTTVVCHTEVRGRLDAPDALSFWRGDGAGGNCVNTVLDAVHWERVDLGQRARVQQVVLSTAAGIASAQGAIQAVDSSRTLVFASGQWASGQAAGEAAYNADDISGEAFGQFALPDPTTVTVTRDSALGSARWTVYVVELLF